MATARTVLAIVNPKTGRRPIDHFIEPLSQEAARRGILLRVVVTTSPGEATILAQNADEHIDTIIAVGGDGTVSDIVAGVLGALTGSPIPDWALGTLIGILVLVGAFRILRLR